MPRNTPTRIVTRLHCSTPRCATNQASIRLPKRRRDCTWCPLNRKPTRGHAVPRGRAFSPGSVEDLGLLVVFFLAALLRDPLAQSAQVFRFRQLLVAGRSRGHIVVR